jgi:glyceraldehyde 3-phosphate dehydrogenase
MIRVAINGFGRIGRNMLWVYLKENMYHDTFEITAINGGNTDLSHAAYLFEYDSILGHYDKEAVNYADNQLIIGSRGITFFKTTDISAKMWHNCNIDWVVDCSGQYTNAHDAMKHITVGGAKKVLISAPAKNEDCSIVMGVNQKIYNPSVHTIVSMTSCTTNAAIPLLFLLDNEYTIMQGSVKTVHAYTNSQVLLDTDAKDFRRSRSATSNIIPTSSGFFKTIEKVLPLLSGKLDGLAIRVPVANISFIDILVMVKSHQSVTAVNEFFHQASKTGLLEGIVGFEKKPLVSSDFLKNPHSVVIDSLLTAVNGDWINVFGWYDNEWAYSKRLCDFLRSHG